MVLLFFVGSESFREGEREGRCEECGRREMMKVGLSCWEGEDIVVGGWERKVLEGFLANSYFLN